MWVIGHRGAAGSAAENTIATMQLAQQQGIKHLELDVVLVEQQLVVFHDRRLERLTGAAGLIGQQSLSQLQQLRVAGESIPTLAQLCQQLRQPVALNIELKGANCAQPLMAYLQQLCQQGWRAEQFLVSSFDHRQLQQCLELAPQFRRAALIEGLPLRTQLRQLCQQLQLYSVNVALDFVSPDLIHDIHQQNCYAMVYTVNHLDDIELMYNWGVDAIFSDYPQEVVKRHGNAAAIWPPTRKEANHANTLQDPVP